MAAKCFIERGIDFERTHKVARKIDDVAVEGKHGIFRVVAPWRQLTWLRIKADTKQGVALGTGLLKTLEELHADYPSELVVAVLAVENHRCWFSIIPNGTRKG
jgi:hypothetical protein